MKHMELLNKIRDIVLELEEDIEGEPIIPPFYTALDLCLEGMRDFYSVGWGQGVIVDDGVLLFIFDGADDGFIFFLPGSQVEAKKDLPEGWDNQENLVEKFLGIRFLAEEANSES